MFGPYTIRERRSDLKRCCALFTCFTSRAVLIEVTIELDTDPFIIDNGTNFILVANELRKALDEINHEQVKHYLLKNGSDWVAWENNPPAASHMEGIWESQI